MLTNVPLQPFLFNGEAIVVKGSVCRERDWLFTGRKEVVNAWRRYGRIGLFKVVPPMVKIFKKQANGKKHLLRKIRAMASLFDVIEVEAWRRRSAMWRHGEYGERKRNACSEIYFSFIQNKAVICESLERFLQEFESYNLSWQHTYIFTGNFNHTTYQFVFYFLRPRLKEVNFSLLNQRKF